MMIRVDWGFRKKCYNPGTIWFDQVYMVDNKKNTLVGLVLLEEKSHRVDMNFYLIL